MLIEIAFLFKLLDLFSEIFIWSRMHYNTRKMYEL